MVNKAAKRQRARFAPARTCRHAYDVSPVLSRMLRERAEWCDRCGTIRVPGPRIPLSEATLQRLFEFQTADMAAGKDDAA